MDLVVDFVRQHSHTMNDGDGDATPTSSDANQVSAPPGDGTMHEMNHAMSPFLFTRSKEFFVLFEGAFINSTGGFVGALILSFVFAIIATVFSQVIRVHENIALADGGIPFRLLASVLHGLRQFLHYTAMLIVMTMNVWLILVVIAGHAVGWFIYSLLLHNRFKSRLNKASPDAKATVAGCDC